MVIGFNKIARGKRIALLAQQDGGSEIGADVDLVREVEPIAVCVNGHAVGGGNKEAVGEHHKTRLMIAEIVVFHGALAQNPGIVEGIETAAESPFQPIVGMKRTVEFFLPIPVVSAQQMGPVGAAITRSEFKTVLGPVKMAAVIREIEKRHFAEIQHGITRNEIFSLYNGK